MMTIFDSIKYPINGRYTSKDVSDLPDHIYWTWIKHKDYKNDDPIGWGDNQDRVRYYSDHNINLLRQIIYDRGDKE